MVDGTGQGERVVLCYGDSNTHGSPPMPDWTGRTPRHGRHVRWPGVLARALGAGWHVVEEGLPGRTTVHDDPIEGEYRNGLRPLQAILESHKPVDLVVLCLGVNDLKSRFGLTANDIARGVERLATVIRGLPVGPGQRAPEVLILVPPPIVEAGVLAEIFAGNAATSQGFAAEYRKVAGRLGVPCLDLGPVAVVDPLDGVHFDAAGHAAIGAAVAAEIRRLWP
jgi:lysophospholipase L1-like esterase